MLRGSHYFVDPWQWCAKSKTVEGRLPLSACRRLLPLLADTDGTAIFSLTFEKSTNRHVVRGSVRADMRVVCQRCLEPVLLRVDETLCLAFVRGIDEAKRLPDDIDPFVVDEQTIDLRVLVEDELILAIPATPRHRLQACTVELDRFSAGDLNEQPDGPFAALAALRGSRHGAD